MVVVVVIAEAAGVELEAVGTADEGCAEEAVAVAVAIAAATDDDDDVVCAVVPMSCLRLLLSILQGPRITLKGW